jgi:hypothetical protein
VGCDLPTGSRSQAQISPSAAISEISRSRTGSLNAANAEASCSGRRDLRPSDRFLAASRRRCPPPQICIAIGLAVAGNRDHDATRRDLSQVIIVGRYDERLAPVDASLMCVPLDRDVIGVSASW